MRNKELYEMIDQHKSHLNFLQESNMCSDDKRSEIVQRVKELYSIISKRSCKLTSSDKTNTNKPVC